MMTGTSMMIGMAPRSDDGAPLTRNQIMLFAAAGSSATVGKSTCVSFPEYVSPYWYCNRYYTDGTHKYGHYFYAGTISYHTVDGEYAFCIEPNTSSIHGATYTSYAGNTANSTTYWMYELDATQRSNIQKILAFGYPQKTYGYSKQAEYAATQVLIWEVVMRHRYADIQNASDYGLYYAVKSTLGNDLYYPYMAILSAIASGISNGKVPSFSGYVTQPAQTVTLTAGSTSSDSVYTLKETKAPTGYQLDNTVYPLTTSYDHYTSASNNIRLTVSDKVITGNLQITKYAYNTVSKEQQPEKGAVFHVWLKSAGSYENASDKVRDTVTIGEDGKGTSRNLPYGLYCVKQVSGWEGYDLDETTYEVRISAQGATVTTDTSGNKLEVLNNIWTGRLDIVKVDKDTRKPLANALFTLTGSDGSKQTIGTGGDGKVFFENLIYGVTYTWEETKAPHGYQLSKNNKGTWTVGKHDDSITITCENQRRPGSISVLKQDSDGNPLSGCTFLLEYLSEAGWKPVVSRSDGVITKGYTTTPGVTDGCLTTGAIGTVTFEGLYADDETRYRLTGVSAPEGYELLSTPVFEGTLPIEADASTVTGTPDEVAGDMAYFYTLPITVRNGKSYVLPMTSGDDFPFFPIRQFTELRQFLRHDVIANQGGSLHIVCVPEFVPVLSAWF